MGTTGAIQADGASSPDAAKARASMPQAGAVIPPLLYAFALTVFALGLVTIDLLELRNSFVGWDFRAFYEGGRDYLHLHSPYVSKSLADLTSRQNFVYPIPTAALFAPLSLLPYHVALGAFIVLSASLLVAALYLLGVRDIRCYLAVLIGAPAFDGLELGTISPILVFLLALIWRYRDRVWIAGTALSLLVLTKIFLWPLAVWLLATRRLKSVAGASVGSALAIVLAALPVGFSVLVHYPRLLHEVSSLEGSSSASLVGFGSALTGSASFGYVVSFLGGALLLARALRSGLKGDDALSFRLTVVAALALTPIVWNHYLALLFVPLALVRPRFSPIWLGTAWVLGAVAATVRGPALVVALGAIWVVVAAQAGIFPAAALNPRRARHVRVLGAFSLCAALVAVLVVALRVVPAVAALRSPDGASAANGTADIRLIRSGTICVRVRVHDVPLPALVQVVEQPSSSVLLERRVNADGRETCGRYPLSPDSRGLAESFSKQRVRLDLKIMSPARRLLLAGEIVRLQDSAPERATD